MSVANAKAEHIEAASKRWDDAVDGIKQLLVHKDPDVRELASLMFTVSESTMSSAFNPLGYGDDTVRTYGAPPDSLIGIMEFTFQFINYELEGNGDPGLGFVRFYLGPEHLGKRTPCSPDHKDALPYFSSSIEELLKDFPNAERLTPRKAADALLHLEKERADQASQVKGERDADLVAGRTPLWDEDDIMSFQPTSVELRRAAVIKEIIALTRAKAQ